jgi:hypothetical protein
MPQSLAALLIAAYFVVPGFLAIVAFDAVVTRISRDTPRIVLEAIAVSLGFWLVTAPLHIWTLQRGYFETHVVFTAFLYSLGAILLPPAAGLAIANWIRRHPRLLSALGIRPPAPRAWDYYFGRGGHTFVIVTLTDGSRLCGLWSDQSFASSYPATEDLYLEALVQLDASGHIGEYVSYTQGAWVPGSAIKTLEFLRPLEVVENAEEE